MTMQPESCNIECSFIIGQSRILIQHWD